LRVQDHLYGGAQISCVLDGLPISDGNCPVGETGGTLCKLGLGVIGAGTVFTNARRSVGDLISLIRMLFFGCN